MISYLTTEPCTDSNEHDLLLNLSEDQSVCLFYTLASVLTIHTEIAPKTKVEHAQFAAAQNCLINQLPKIISRYCKEFSGFGFDILFETIGLLMYLDLDFILKQHLNSQLEELLGKLTELYMIHPSPLMLKEISRVFNHFSVVESSNTNIVALANSANLILHETIEQLLSALNTLSQKLNDYSVEKLHENSVLADLQAMSNCLSRLYHLSASIPLFQSLAAQAFGMERTNGLFALMDSCLEGTLQVLKAHVETPNDKSHSFYQFCNESLYFAIKLMAGEYIDSVSKLYKESDASQEMIEVTKWKQDRLFNFLEAVSSDVEGEFFQIQFSFLQRSFCLETLFEIAPVLTGPVVQKYLVLQRPLSKKLQSEAFVLIQKLIYIVVFELPFNDEKVAHAQSLEFRFDMFTLIGTLINGATQNTIRLNGFASLFSFYGFTNDVGRIWPFAAKNQISEHILQVPPSILGEAWNSLCDHLLKTTVGDFHCFIDKMFLLDLEQELKLVRIQEYCKSVFAMLCGGIQKVKFM
jgi:hypothetical protein